MRLIGKRLLVGVVTLLLTATSPALPASAAPHVRSGAIGGDFTVFRPSNGTWYTYLAGIRKLHFGARGDIPVPGFYSQRSRPNIAVFRPSTGNWYIRGVGKIHYGRPGDVPVPGTYDGPDFVGTYGTGKTNVAVFRPSTGNWYIRGVGKIHYGRPGDVPVPADYNGDGYTDIAVFRPSTGTWYVRGIGTFHYGKRGDIPVPGSYVARNSRAQIAVFRPSTGNWYILGVGTYHYGKHGDIPVPAVFTSHERTDIAVFRPSNGTWYVRGGRMLHYGQRGDVPVPGAYTGGPIYYSHADERVREVAAKPGWGSVTLSWAPDSYRTAVMIRRAKGSVAPFSPTSGTLVARTGNTAFTDTGLRENATYSYSLFAIYKKRYAAAPATVTVRTGAPSTITGTVTDAKGAGLSDIGVRVFRPTASRSTAQATTDSHGRYAVRDLRAGNYTVCFDARSAKGGSSTTGYLSACYKNTAWRGYDAPADNAALVNVRSASTVTVDAALHAGGAISGNVTAGPDGTGLSGVDVTVFGSQGSSVGTTTEAGGFYQIGSLPSGQYTVCFEPDGITAAGSSAGYVGQCYDNVGWNWSAGTRRPQSITPVTVDAGSSTTVDAALADAGAISGTVRTATNDATLSRVTVELFDAQGKSLGSTQTDSAGVYSIDGLEPGTYTVCFDAREAVGGSVATGYVSECDSAVPWAPPRTAPSAGSEAVSVSARATTTVNAQLAVAGLLSGTVSTAAGGAKLDGAHVEVFDSAGNLFTVGYTRTDGSYVIHGLADGSYTVCFDAGGSAGGSSATGYAGQCDDAVPWNTDPTSPADGSTLVAVHAGETATVNAALTAGGAISGTVSSGGAGVQNAEVELFAPDGQELWFATAETDVAGSYMVRDLTPGTAYTVCFDASVAWVGGNPPSADAASQCYQQVAWDGNASEPPPAGTTLVSVTAENTTTLNVSLPEA